MRNTGRESSVQIQQQKTAQAARRREAMKTDRVAWFRTRKSV